MREKPTYCKGLFEAILEYESRHVRQILERGADPNKKWAGEETPLHLAAKRPQTRARGSQWERTHLVDGTLEIIHLLVEYGADINAQTFQGATPLLYAIEIGDLAPVQLFLELGADPNITGYDNPYRCAKRGGHKEIMQCLVDHGAITVQPSTRKKMLIVMPDQGIEVKNPRPQIIAEMVRRSFRSDDGATVLVVDVDNHLFIQNIGEHVEYNDPDTGDIYAADVADVEVVVNLYLAYAQRKKRWKAGVPWTLYLSMQDSTDADR